MSTATQTDESAANDAATGSVAAVLARDLIGDDLERADLHGGGLQDHALTIDHHGNDTDMGAFRLVPTALPPSTARGSS